MQIDQVVKHLARQRKALGRSMGAVAGAIGISVPGLSQLEAGITKPSQDTLVKWANFLGVTVAWDTVSGYRIEPKGPQ